MQTGFYLDPKMDICEPRTDLEGKHLVKLFESMGEVILGEPFSLNNNTDGCNLPF